MKLFQLHAVPLQGGQGVVSAITLSLYLQCL